MRLTFFSPYYLPYISGITTYPKNLFDKLRQNHSIRILTFNHQSKQPYTVKGNPHIDYLGWNTRVSKGFINAQTMQIFKKALKKTDVLLINIPNVEGLPLVYLAKKANIPIISIVHCMPVLPKSIKNSFINAVLNWSIKYQLKRSNVITTYTSDYQSSQLELQKYKEKTIHTLPPIPKVTPDTSMFNKLKQKKQDEIWLGFVGRVAAEKGIVHLVEAISLSDISKLRLIIVGPDASEVAGEEKTALTVQKMIKQHKIKVTYIPSQTGPKLAAVYKALDILFLTSINQTESFGMVQIEAMRQGVPVIATNLPGVRVPIQETGMGIIVPTKNPQAIAKAISKIINKKDKFTNKQSINQANNLCLPEVSAKEYEKIIQTISQQ